MSSFEFPSFFIVLIAYIALFALEILISALGPQYGIPRKHLFRLIRIYSNTKRTQTPDVICGIDSMSHCL